MDDTNVDPTIATTDTPVVEETKIVEPAVAVEETETPAVEETTTPTEETEAPAAE